MNHSIYSADRATHLKIMVVALIAGLAVAGLGISARLSADDGHMQTDSGSGPEALDATEAKDTADKGVGCVLTLVSGRNEVGRQTL
jgi:hypothetical protein